MVLTKSFVAALIGLVTKGVQNWIKVNMSKLMMQFSSTDIPLIDSQESAGLRSAVDELF